MRVRPRCWLRGLRSRSVRSVLDAWWRVDLDDLHYDHHWVDAVAGHGAGLPRLRADYLHMPGATHRRPRSLRSLHPRSAAVRPAPAIEQCMWLASTVEFMGMFIKTGRQQRRALAGDGHCLAGAARPLHGVYASRCQRWGARTATFLLGGVAGRTLAGPSPCCRRGTPTGRSISTSRRKTPRTIGREP
jgi:hypothetical protein